MADLSAASDDQLRLAVEAVSVPSDSPEASFTNWAKTFHCKPQRVFAPTTILQCRQIIELARRDGAIVHPVGVGHSPSDLACTNGWLLRMEGLSGLLSVSDDYRRAKFLAGTTLHRIHDLLASIQPPLALPNIGSISDQTIGGLISTASHGSGVDYPVLSQHVTSLTLALPLPGIPIVTASQREDVELFKASLCGLGATGLLLEVEVEVEKAFRLRETKEAKHVNEVIEQLDSIKSSAQHVRVWWYPDAQGVVVGRANRTFDPASPQSSLIAHILGFHVTQFFLFVARYIPSFTPWVGKWAWWLSKADSEVVDDGWKVLNFDCLFPQYTLEWALPSANAKACLADLRDWLADEAADPHGLRVHFPIEVRWTCADDIWLSPSYGRDTAWIGVVTYRPYGLPVPYRKYQQRFAEILASHDGRPHWAKQHDLTPKDIEAMYPKFDAFRSVLERVDPQGVMRSEYVRRHLSGDSVPHRLFKKRPE